MYGIVSSLIGVVNQLSIHPKLYHRICTCATDAPLPMLFVCYSSVRVVSGWVDLCLAQLGTAPHKGRKSGCAEYL